MRRGEHFVQFYEEGKFPAASVGAFLYDGLVNQETCIIASLPEHGEEVRKALDRSGFDIETARKENRLIEIGARETLNLIMIEGMPDLRALSSIIRPVMEKALSKGKVRFFGELVALLAADNNLPASLRLEEYWNALQGEYDFHLFCAYPDSAFDDAGGRDALLAMCGQHTHIVPSDALTTALLGDERFKSVQSLQEWNRELHAELEELERSIAQRHQRED